MQDSPNQQQTDPDPAQVVMDEAQEEQQRTWRDEAKETFVNLMFAREGIMQSRVRRNQEFEERLREKALNGKIGEQEENAMARENEGLGAVSVGNKAFHFHETAAAAEKKPAGLLKAAALSMLPLGVGVALTLAGLDYFGKTPDLGTPKPAVSVRTALKLPDGTVVPIRPELFDSTEFYPERR